MEAPPAQDLLEEIFGSEWSGSGRTQQRAVISKIEPSSVVPTQPVVAAETCFSPQPPGSLCGGRAGQHSEETNSVADEQDCGEAGSEHDPTTAKSLADFAADTTTPPPRRNSNNSIRGILPRSKYERIFFDYTFLRGRVEKKSGIRAFANRSRDSLEE